MTPLRSLNPLEFTCSHWILSICFPLCPFLVIVSLGEGSSTSEFHFLLLLHLLSVLRHSGLLLFLLLLLTGECLMSLPPFLIHLVSTSLKEAEEEKALKNIRIRIEWFSSGVSCGPSDLGFAVGRTLVSLGWLLLSCHIHFHSTQDPGFVAAIKRMNNFRS